MTGEFLGCFSIGKTLAAELEKDFRIGIITGESMVSLESCFGLKNGSVHLCGDDQFDESHKNDENLFATEAEVYARIMKEFPDIFAWSGDKAVLKWELNAQ